MRRGLLLFVSLGLLSALSGCRHSQSSCGCQTPAADHLSPSPIVSPATSGGSLYSGPAGSTVAPPLGH